MNKSYRNGLIIFAYSSGVPASILAQGFSLSIDRIRQIIADSERIMVAFKAVNPTDANLVERLLGWDAA